MTVFASKDGTGNYHMIKIKYDDYYSIPNYNTNVNDLKRFIPIC
jgi:hypothetical protein